MKLVHAIHEPAGAGPHPTIFALHGYGANAMDLLGLAPHLLGGRALVVAPQGPDVIPLGPPGMSPVGYGWFPLSLGGSPDPAAVANGIGKARDFLAEARSRYPIDPARTVLLGFSQGGVVAYSIALANPGQYRGLAALSSWLPAEIADSLGDGDRSKLDTWVHHGTQDDVITVSRARDSKQRLEKLGVPVTYNEYGMGHEINAESVRDLDAWLTELLA